MADTVATLIDDIRFYYGDDSETVLTDAKLLRLINQNIKDICRATTINSLREDRRASNLIKPFDGSQEYTIDSDTHSVEFMGSNVTRLSLPSDFSLFNYRKGKVLIEGHREPMELNIGDLECKLSYLSASQWMQTVEQKFFVIDGDYLYFTRELTDGDIVHIYYKKILTDVAVGDTLHDELTGWEKALMFKVLTDIFRIDRDDSTAEYYEGLFYRNSLQLYKDNIQKNTGRMSWKTFHPRINRSNIDPRTGTVRYAGSSTGLDNTLRLMFDGGDSET